MDFTIMAMNDGCRGLEKITSDQPKRRRRRGRRRKQVAHHSWGAFSVPKNRFPSGFRAEPNATPYPMVIGISNANNYVALDCEMVGVGPGGHRSVLARVSLVDIKGLCLFDKFVRVEEKVTDYRTHVSGVRAEDLKSPSAMPFGACREIILNFLTNKVLVGHALENDLQVLRVSHPWYDIRDTSTFEPFMWVDCYGRLRPKRLRDLARDHLGVLIQQAEHNPVVDATVAMELYKQVQPQWDMTMEWNRKAVGK